MAAIHHLLCNMRVRNVLLFTVRRQKRLFSSKTQISEERPAVNVCQDVKEPLTYGEFLMKRHEEASRTLMVKVKSQNSISSVCSKLEQFGDINEAFYSKGYILVEFKKKDTVKDIVSNIAGPEYENAFSVETRVLQFSGQGKSGQVKSNGAQCIVESNKNLNASELRNLNTISVQMLHVHSRLKLSEFGLRFRFFTCSMLEDFISGMLPNCRIHPFGSCVNGFGCQTSDLDLAITLPSKKKNSVLHKEFSFLYKNLLTEELFSRKLDEISRLMRSFLPSVNKVYFVRHARVPIIKFNLSLMNMACDLSFSNLSGSKMSELLYLYSQLDPRVQPLACTVKTWASNQMLSKSSPGPWPTNFTLLAMVVFFLQSQCKSLPSLESMSPMLDGQNLFGPEEIDYPTLTNLQSLVPSQSHTDSLGDLFVEFLDFYHKFDFHSKGLSLIKGQDIVKPVNQPVYIENPFEHGHNVAKNVNNAYVRRMKQEMEFAVKHLTTTTTNDRTGSWGIIPLVCGSNNDDLSFQVSSLFSKISEYEQETKTTSANQSQNVGSS